MKNKDIRNSTILKTISLLTLPLLVMILISGIVIIVYGISYPEIKTDKPYFETESFRNQYQSKLYSCTTSVKTVKDALIDNYGQYENGLPTRMANKTESGTVYYNQNQYYSEDSNFIYLVINPDTMEAYTNLPMTGKTDTIEKIKDILAQYKLFWNYENGKIQSSIEGMQEDDLKYTYLVSTFGQNGNYVYTALSENLQNLDSFQTGAKIYTMVQKLYNPAFWAIIISSILLLIEVIYLVLAVGHTKKQEEITLNRIDKISLEFYIILVTIVLSLFLALGIGTGEIVTNNYWFLIPCGIGIYLFILASVYFLGSCLKKIKTKTFWKNSITYKLWKFCTKRLKKLYEEFVYDANSTIKLAIVFGGFIFVSIFIILLTGMFGFLSVLVLLGFWIYCYWFLLQRMKEFNKIKETTKAIYEGKTDIRLEETQLKGVLKEFATYLNDIAGGFSNAVEESLKSERLKTELITNVSHDIKTPLTSIINYVDLLKREDIQDEKVQEYIEVLDQKSQRLKKLIEDLVEASKASSGNIKLQKEQLKVKELIKQVTGEFEDRFNQKNLKVIMDFPKEEVEIIADNRYLYRVIENLYSNIAKYALEGSRVYVDVVKNNGKIIIAIKNISKEELNISVEELMQRFVRGDKARNTEGSGLGLSIAQSLTELQGGKFNIYLDGDLFKVVLEF